MFVGEPVRFDSHKMSQKIVISGCLSTFRTASVRLLEGIDKSQIEDDEETTLF